MSDHEIKVGQIWEGSVIVGFRRVKIIKVGNQPKRRRITYAYHSGGTTQPFNRGYEFTDYESVFRHLYGRRS